MRLNFWKNADSLSSSNVIDHSPALNIEIFNFFPKSARSRLIWLFIRVKYSFKQNVVPWSFSILWFHFSIILKNHSNLSNFFRACNGMRMMVRCLLEWSKSTSYWNWTNPIGKRETSTWYRHSLHIKCQNVKIDFRSRHLKTVSWDKYFPKS